MKPVSAVAICIATHQRISGLSRLLASLAVLRFNDNRPQAVHIIVADNDPEESARATCAAFERNFPGRLHYVVEPRKGFSSARNRALRQALTLPCGLVAFVDDDGMPEPDWLDSLISAMGRHDADAVHGMMVRRFDRPPPEWVRRGGFFGSPDWESGKTLEFGNTANLLAKRVIFDALGGFDAAYDASSGEDDDMFHRAALNGYKIVFCREAVVLEFIPPDRTTIRWILKRNFRIGGNWARIHLKIHPGLSARLLVAAQGLWRIAAAALWLPAKIWSKHSAVCAGALFLRGLGRLSALTGSFDENGRTR